MPYPKKWDSTPDPPKNAGRGLAEHRIGDGFAPFCKQLRHVVGVRGVYNAALAAGKVDRTRKHEHYSGPLTREALRAALDEKHEKLLATLATVDIDATIDWNGTPFTFALFTWEFVQHEAIHHGQWSIYASLAGSTHRSVGVRRGACKFGIVAIELTVQIVPFFMTGFDPSGSRPKKQRPDFGGRRFFRAIGLAIWVGILFYVTVIAAVSFDAPPQTLLNESFATAVALEKSVGSHWVASLIMATAFLSVLKCLNGNMVATSRMLYALGRRGLAHPGVAYVHPRNLTPSV